MQFVPFPKIARLSRDVVITEKLDGTNAQVTIVPCQFGEDYSQATAIVNGGGPPRAVFAGSRSRWITPNKTKEQQVGGMKLTSAEKATDNFGFAAWVRDHADELVEVLGEGTHFGEWWGQGIQRGYGLSEKRFSLFNTARWGTHYDDRGRVGPCHVVPTLYAGPLIEQSHDGLLLESVHESWLKLYVHGSVAAPGFKKAEGMIIYHRAANQLFKMTLEKDDEPKGRSR